jgi:pimeloyl-ACP methyl ester carboxylesterase
MRKCLFLLLLIAPAFAEEKVADPKQAFLKKIRYKPVEYAVDADDPAPSKRVPGVTELKIRFPSPYKSIDPVKNDTVHARLFFNRKPDNAAVIVLGGWMTDPMTPVLAEKIALTGLQMLYVEIPFQEHRTPVGKQTGRVTLSDDIDQNMASFEQITQDVARGVDWLVASRGIDPKRIGIMGTSLGGFAAASLYGMNDRFRAAVVMLAGADLGEVLFAKNWLLKPLAEKLEARELTKEIVSKRMRMMAPRTWAREDKRAGLYLIAARSDEIIPFATSVELARLYGGARLDVLPMGGHIAAAFQLTSFVDRIGKHFQEHLAAKKPVPVGAGEDR